MVGAGGHLGGSSVELWVSVWSDRGKRQGMWGWGWGWGLGHHLSWLTLDSWVSLALCLNLPYLGKGSEFSPTSTTEFSHMSHPHQAM